MEAREDHGRLLIFFLLSGYFLLQLTPALASPFLPKMTELHGQEDAVTGWMLGFLPLAVSCCNIFWFKYLRRIPWKLLLKGGMTLVGLCTAAFGCLEFIPNDEGAMFTAAGFLIRIIHAVGCSAVITTTQAIITNIFTENRTFMLSVATAIGGVGLICGPAIGSGLFKLGGFWLVFIGVGGLNLILAVFMIIFLPNFDNVSTNETDSKYEVPYKKLFMNWRTILAMLVGWFTSVCWGAIDPILEPELRDKFQFTQDISALVFLPISAPFVIAAPILGRLVGRSYCMDSVFVMAIGLAIKVAIFLLAGPSAILGGIERPFWLLMICLPLMGVSNGILYVSAQDVLYNTERLGFADGDSNLKAIKSVIASVWNGSYSLGSFCGLIFSGHYSQYFGWPSTMTAYAVATFALMLLTFFLKTYEAIKAQVGSKDVDEVSDSYTESGIKTLC